MAWVYEPAARRYRETTTGRFLGPSQMVELRDAFTRRMQERAAALSVELGEGGRSVASWEREMRALVKSVHVDLAALGKGGRRQMTPADWGRVGQAVKSQYRFLGNFADASADLSAAQVSARAGLYMAAGTASYERAAAAAAGAPDLPEYPGDGSQECGANCRCAWSIEATGAGWEATWLAADDQGTCASCAANAARWSPLVVPAEAGAAAPVEAAA